MESNSIQRHNLVNRKDIQNVEMRMGLKVAQKSSNDLTSVDLWVQGERAKYKEKTSLFCYSEQDSGGNFSLGRDFPHFDFPIYFITYLLYIFLRYSNRIPM